MRAAFVESVRFNPRPREGATRPCSSRSRSRSVSIHAPAKGRLIAPAALPTVSGFQSTPPRRGDWERSISIFSGTGFNPRPREGATCSRRLSGATATVSIHAPAKGRPSWRRWRCSPWVSFNPRPREGATVGRLEREEDVECFNPRPREGATLVRRSSHARSCVSIHAPAKGRHHVRLIRLRPFVVSIHAPAKGRREPGIQRSSPSGFQSTPPRRGD